MVTTYSVIIQSEQTSELFSTYKPLFADALRNGTVGLCTWAEYGRNIDEALAGIRELTDDKKEWNAVIVLSEDDCRRLESPERAQNPFDFGFDFSKQEIPEDSSNPLIRLTHMLGGYPAIEKHFEKKVIEPEDQEPYVVYEPVAEPEREKAFNELQSKYEFDGILPEQIIIIAQRSGWREKEDISVNWKNYNEIQSSEFWRRNGYPSNCRFIVFDMVRQGPVRREADCFRFFMSVELLASNKVDPSSLQAYRLYRIDSLFDKDSMEDVFQGAVNRLSSAKHTIRAAMRRDAKSAAYLSSKLPDFRTDIPVVFDIPEYSRRAVKPENFRLISSSHSEEIADWKREKRHAEEALIKSVRIADRALDKTASRMKDTYVYDEEDVVKLDKYQRDDMILETDLLYSEIIELQGQLPTEKEALNKDTETRSRAVIDALRSRPTVLPVTLTLAGCILTVILMQIPTIMQFAGTDYMPWGMMFAEVLGFTAAAAVGGLIALLVGKRRLGKLIDAFNNMMRGAFGQLQTNARDYSEYLGAVASHSRGRSYLALSDKKDAHDNNIIRMQIKHLNAIDAFLGRMNTWSNAFHLDVDYNQPEVNEDTPIDIWLSPSENPMYTLEVGRKYEVAMNRSGIVVSAPFAFVKGVELVREELYENVANNN